MPTPCATVLLGSPCFLRRITCFLISYCTSGLCVRASIFSMYRVYHITGYIAIYYCRGNISLAYQTEPRPRSSSPVGNLIPNVAECTPSKKIGLGELVCTFPSLVSHQLLALVRTGLPLMPG